VSRALSRALPWRSVANRLRLRHALWMQKSPTAAYGKRFGVARILSKRGLCSRRQAEIWVVEGRVRVNGQVVLDPEHPVRADRDVVTLGEQPIGKAERLCIMLNKPRGLLCTTRDERGRDTVYQCLADSGLPWLAPVGRLDRASEGLLLFSNDPEWAASVLDPRRGPDKTYHVQVDRLVDAAQIAAMQRGVEDAGEVLRFRQVRVLRQGTRNTWLEIVLDEGRNRQIRRVLAALEIGVLRLLRVAIGGLLLGDLPKGAWRRLSGPECVDLLAEADRADRDAATASRA